MDARERIAKANFEKSAVTITSTITLIEVLSCSLTEEQEKQFRLSFRPQDHLLYELDSPIAFKARESRERFTKQGGKTLSTPDAIHLATAAIYKAHWFVTFDDGKKGRFVGLLDLNKDPQDEIRVVTAAKQLPGFQSRYDTPLTINPSRGVPRARVLPSLSLPRTCWSWLPSSQSSVPCFVP